MNFYTFVMDGNKEIIGDDGEITAAALLKLGRDYVLDLYRKYMDSETKPNGWDALVEAVNIIERSEGGGWSGEQL